MENSIIMKYNVLNIIILLWTIIIYRISILWIGIGNKEVQPRRDIKFCISRSRVPAFVPIFGEPQNVAALRAECLFGHKFTKNRLTNRLL